MFSYMYINLIHVNKEHKNFIFVFLLLNKLNMPFGIFSDLHNVFLYINLVQVNKNTKILHLFVETSVYPIISIWKFKESHSKLHLSCTDMQPIITSIHCKQGKTSRDNPTALIGSF